MEEGPLATAKKTAARQGQTILCVDESGLSERPHRCRTWAPRGETPVLQYHFNWHTLAAIAGVSWWKFYFQLHAGTIKGPQVVAFLTHLLRHVRGKLLILWDKLPAHRSRLVHAFLLTHRDRLTTEFLPSYAPELNPTEYLWGHWKQHELPNFCPPDFAQLSTTARHALRRMRRRPSLMAAFWQQADLFDCHYIK